MPRGVLDRRYASERSGGAREMVFRYRARALVAADALRGHLDAESLEIVDFGSAEGRGLVELARLLPDSRITGIEASAELIASAPPLPDSIRLVAGDVAELPHEIGVGRGVDGVTALALLEHLPAPGRAVAEAARVLRPGGLFVATCPSGAWDRLATALGLLAGDQHEHRLGLAELSELARQAGLEVVSAERFMFAPVGVLPYLGIAISPRLASVVDDLVRRLRIFDWLFVNQRLVARKPVPSR